MASSGSADEADQDILIRGVYESGIVEYKRSRSLLSSKSKWFATACRTDAFMEGQTGIITIPLTESWELDVDADNLEASRRMMHFFDHEN